MDASRVFHSRSSSVKKEILRPEDRLVLAIAVPESLAKNELAELGNNPRLSWEETHRLALHNRLGSPAWTLIDGDPQRKAVDEKMRSRWRLAHRAVVSKDAAAREQLAELAVFFSNREIRPLLYKGLDFQDRYYSKERLRTFSDLDLIVDRDDALRADDTLRSAGYRPWNANLPLAYYLRFHLHAAYSHPKWPMPLELHWSLDSPYAETTERVRPILAAATTGPEFGPHVLRPTATDALALMAIHLEKHIGLCATLPSPEARLKSVILAGGLIWVLDVVGWLRTECGQDGERVVDRFRTLDAEGSLAVALRLARDLHPASLPEWARALADRVRPTRSLVSRIAYPDLSADRAVTRFGERTRRFLLTPISGLTFRPIRVLEAIAPRVLSPGAMRPPWRSRIGRTAQLGALALANLFAIARLQLRRRFGRATRSGLR
jgi:hypothetical protein